MNLATTQQQQQSNLNTITNTTPNIVPTTVTATTTAPLGATANVCNTKSSSNLTSSPALPKAFVTAQNCGYDFATERPIPPPRAGKSKATAAKLTLMIKNNESSSNPVDADEKEEEEEKDICNVQQRRDSINEEPVSVTQSNRLNPIEEQNEIKDLPSQTVNAPLLATSTPERSNNTSTSSQATAVTPVDAHLLTSSSETQQKETPEYQHQPQLSTSSSTEKFSVELIDDSAAAGDSPLRRSSSSASKAVKLPQTPSSSKIVNSLQSSLSNISGRVDEDTVSKSSDTSGELVRSAVLTELGAPGEKPKSGSRLSERAKKKSWYNVLYPNYKSRADDFKKLFKEVPSDERLIVDYSCALQRDILVQGRLYVSQNYVCFHANIFRWETYLSIKWKDVTAITKEKTALVIPNAISICTTKEKFFFATFTSRDKAYLMLFRVWQNTLMNKQMPPQEVWQWVHNCYGDELGLTTDDEDYIDPTSVPQETDVDLDFVSALEDNSSVQTLGVASDYTTASSATGVNNSVSSSTSTSSGTGNVTKSKSRSYFFSSNKSNLNSSATASASGSDNKASDNNSGGDCRSKMKANAKELTFMSVKPDENVSDGGVAVATKGGDNSTTGAGSNTAELGKPNGKNDSGSSGGKDIKSAVNAPHAHDGKRKVAKNIRLRDESLNKTMAELQTDISDSSDSDENKIPFVVTAECTSSHEGRQLVHTILPINIDTLFNMLFSKSKFLVEFHAMRKSTDTNFGEWVTDENGKKTRIVNVTVQLGASVGPKASKVTEYQEMRECSKSGELYSIDINSVNAGIPYADSFSVQMHYCMVRTIDDHTMMSVHAQIKYKKSIWGVVKGFIEKNTWAGLEDFYTSLLHALQSETCIPPAKGKGRRPRRGTAAQVRPAEEASDAQTKLEPAESTLATNGLAPQLPIATQHSLAGDTAGKYKWLSLFVIILLCFLIVLNVILLLKLWKLEERIEEDAISRGRMPNLSSLKQLPNSHQEWIALLRQQEILHETELKKWHKVLQVAIDLLKKTEKTLAELMFR